MSWFWVGVDSVGVLSLGWRQEALLLNLVEMPRAGRPTRPRHQGQPPIVRLGDQRLLRLM